MLNKDPETRLGAGSQGAKDIKEEAYYEAAGRDFFSNVINVLSLGILYVCLIQLNVELQFRGISQYIIFQRSKLRKLFSILYYYEAAGHDASIVLLFLFRVYILCSCLNNT